MKYGLLFANFGNYGDVHLLADLAQQAEEAGWSGVFLMDTLCFEDGPTCDPWIALAAIALRTRRIALGLQVAALSRRRPWKVVREAVTLDHLSGGRLILGVGAGTAYDPGFAAFGEEMDAKKRAAMLDESLEILPGLWSGKPFRFQGEHYHIGLLGPPEKFTTLSSRSAPGGEGAHNVRKTSNCSDGNKNHSDRKLYLDPALQISNRLCLKRRSATVGNFMDYELPAQS